MKIVFIFIVFFLAFICLGEEKFIFKETFNNTSSLEEIKSRWSYSAISKNTASVSQHFPERGNVLEVHASSGSGLQLKLNFLATSKLKASIKIFLKKESDAFFRNGLFAIKSGDKYVVSNIVSKHKNTAIMQHAERYSKRDFTVVETIPCEKWVTMTLTVDCMKDSAIYEAAWDNWKWKKETILSNKAETVNELIIRTPWRKDEKSFFYIDDIFVSNN